MNMHLYRAFGFWIESALELPWLAGVESMTRSVSADVKIKVDAGALNAHAGIDPYYTSRWMMPDGEPFLRAYRRGHDEVWRFHDGVCFVMQHDAIDVAWPDADPKLQAHQAQIWLLGPVMAFWVERRGELALHASAIVIDGVAVAFAASSRGGKSTLAASFVQAGASLLTDDILPCSVEGGRAIGQPGFPGMRLWPAEAERFVGNVDSLDLVHPSMDKRRTDVGAGAFGRFHASSEPIACLYLPARREEEAGPPHIDITPINKREALVELGRMSFMGLMAQSVFNASARMDMLARLAQTLTVKRLSYPSGYAHLPAVREAILCDARAAVPSQRLPDMTASA